MIITDRKQVFKAITEYTPIKLFFVGDTKYKKIYSAVFVNHTADIIYLVTKNKGEIMLNMFKSDGTNDMGGI